MNEQAAARLRALAADADEAFDLADAALTLADEEYPDLDHSHYLARLDELAANLKKRIPADMSAGDRIISLNRYLFDELGFRPNDDDYWDPRNSFLNEVLDRRVGIPITLSLVYLEIGRRLGLPLSGVAFPGHFLVKCRMFGGFVVLDPYSRGVSLSLDDLHGRLKAVAGEALPRDAVAQLIRSASKKQILVRMLRNLKGVYLHRERLTEALTAVERILAIAPDEADELRDRGAIYAALECWGAAAADFERYLELDPDADDADAIRDRLVELRHAASRVN